MSSEHAILLFTDLVGSTELLTSCSPAEADQLRRRHFSVLNQAIESTGGRLCKNLGDGVMVIFDSASAAIACAVVMQQGVDAENRRSSRALQVRIGISGGEVTREGDDVFGDPVVEAARLCAASEGGQVLASDVVRLIAGRRSAYDTRPIGLLTLKGLPEPVSAVEVLWSANENVVATDIPLPSQLVARPGVLFTGRRDETSTISDWLSGEQNDARLELLLITGEAGQGKTTLAAELARRAHDRGACVLFGGCEQGISLPYQPFARAIDHYVRHADEQWLESHVAQHGSALSRLAPSLARRVAHLPPTRATDPDAERFLLFAAVVDLFVGSSRGSTTVVVLDDVQWADDATLSLLRYLASSDQMFHVRVLATCRDNEIAQSPSLVETVGALQRRSALTRLDLAGVGTDDVIAILADAGFEVSDAARALAGNIFRETDGNPFFISEVVRHLVESQGAREGPDAIVVSEQLAETTTLPVSLVDVIAARTARLSKTTNEVLSRASVIGREFSVELLAHVAGQPMVAVLDILDEGVAASLLRESRDAPGRFTFAHALIQHALYERVGLARRSLVHRDVALAMESLYGEFDEDHALELARHWSLTHQSEDQERALRYLCLAGTMALRSLAPLDALHLFQDAASLQERSRVNDADLAIDIATGLGTAQRQSGVAAFRETLLEASTQAARCGDTARLVRAVLANSRGWYTSTGIVDWEKVAFLELALERSTEASVERALVLGTLCSELTFSDSLDRRLALAEEALTMARAFGDDAIVVRILNLVVFPHLVPPLLERSLDWSAEAVARAERVGDPVLSFSAALYRATVATRAGDIDEVDRCFEVASRFVTQLQQPSLTWEYTFHLARRAQIAGNIEEAVRLASAALAIGTEYGEPDAATFFGVQYAAVAWQNGTMADLVPILEQMINENPRLQTLPASLAMALSEGGEFARCREVLSAFAESNYELRMDAAWINGMTEYAVAAINLDDPLFAAPLYERLLPFAAQFSSAGGLTAEGPVSLFLGQLATVLGRYDEAVGHLDAAEAFAQRHGAWFFGAQSAYAYGQLLSLRGRSGDLDRSRELLRRAHAQSSARGYARIATKAATKLAT